MTLGRSRSWLLTTVALAGLSCSGGGPGGVLTITLDHYAKVTNAATITITGTVTRTPATNTRIIVRATGGLGTPTDTAVGGHFSLAINLNPNATNTFSITASDASGSTSDAIAVSIREDNLGASIAQATPADASDSISLTTPVQIKMSEPVIVASGGGLRLSRQGVTVSGASSISADSLTLTFVPLGPLSPNAIYRIGFSGVTDLIGNTVGSSACFVTTLVGAAKTQTFADPAGDVFSSNPAPALSIPDLTEVRFAREGTSFSGVFRFVGPRTFSTVLATQASVLLDLDVDQDSTTGFTTFKDTLFKISGLDTLSSGTRAEYVIGIDPLTDLGDSAYVGKYVTPFEFNVISLFIPGVCGAFMGFVTPFDALGPEDGKMNALVTALNGTGNLIYIDPVPTKGHLTLDLSVPGGPAPDARAAILPAPFDRTARIRLRVPRYLSHH